MRNGNRAAEPGKKGKSLRYLVPFLGSSSYNFYLGNVLKTEDNAMLYGALDSLLLRGFRRVNGNTKTKVM